MFLPYPIVTFGPSGVCRSDIFYFYPTNPSSIFHGEYVSK